MLTCVLSENLSKSAVLLSEFILAFLVRDPKSVDPESLGEEL